MMRAMFGGGPVTLSGAWSDIGYAAPTTEGTNEDRTLNFGGGTRSITASSTVTNTLQYRINSGSWTTYSAAFSLASGQTLGWRVVGSTPEFASVTVHANGTDVDTFGVAILA